MPKLEQSLPPAVHVDLMADRSQTTRASIHDVQFTMMLTIGLVIVVIFLFLRTLWATVIPSLAVPLSLLATFAFMYVGGYSIDNISLMGLTISVGFIVDDAIVMIENIVRYIEQGMRPFDAALKGAGQIGFTIISITLSLIAVFIPLLFMGGIIGRLFREFAVTISVAVVASAVISLTLTPVMCSLFLRQEGLHPKGRFNRGCERVFQAALGAYDRGLTFIFRHQPSALVATLLLMVATGYLYAKMPKGFFPQQDTGFIFGELNVRQDSSVANTDRIRRQVVDIVMHDPGVEGVFSYAGATPYNPAENTARIFWGLKPYDERAETAQQIIQRLSKKVAGIKGAKFYMQVPQNITVGGRLSRTQYQYTLTDTDIDELDHWAPIIEAGMKKLPELQQVASDQQIAAAHLAIDVDRDAAYRLGLSADLIDQTLYDAFGQRQVATIYTATNQYKVVLEVQPQFRNDPNLLSQIYVSSSSGAQVPLSTVARFTRKSRAAAGQPPGHLPGGDAVVQPDARRRARTGGQRHRGDDRTPARAGDVECLVRGDGTGLPGLAVVDAAAAGRGDPRRLHRARRPVRKLHPPDHHPVGAALGRRRRAVAVDAAALRAVGDRDRRHRPVDRHRQEERDHDDRLCVAGPRIEGKPPQEAIHQACLLRFRPIMMTTFAALFGAVPIAFGTGGGAELRQPLGVAIIGGLLVSQWLTLYTTPVIYLYLERLSRWLGGAYRPSRVAEALGGRTAAEGTAGGGMMRGAEWWPELPAPSHPFSPRCNCQAPVTWAANPPPSSAMPSSHNSMLSRWLCQSFSISMIETMTLRRSGRERVAIFQMMRSSTR